MIVWGYTGTQAGMSERQWDALIAEFEAGRPDEAHHGDCIGGDAEFHAMCIHFGVPHIVIHPPSDPKKRAFCADRQAVQTEEVGVKVTLLPERPYLDRNHDVVDAVGRPDVTGRMFAAPKEMEEQVRSGTWATWRYSKKRGVPTTLLER